MILDCKKHFATLQLPTNKYRGQLLIYYQGFRMVEITRLFWKKAVTSDSMLLGEVESAELDMNTWQITNFYVGLTDEATRMMGFKRPFLGKVVVCLPASLIQSFEDKAVLNKTMKELSNLKECKE
jgi:sporulation protein YlmC with PRC-barrel domain